MRQGHTGSTGRTARGRRPPAERRIAYGVAALTAILCLVGVATEPAEPAGASGATSSARVAGATGGTRTSTTSVSTTTTTRPQVPGTSVTTTTRPGSVTTSTTTVTTSPGGSTSTTVTRIVPTTTTPPSSGRPGQPGHPSTTTSTTAPRTTATTRPIPTTTTTTTTTPGTVPGPGSFDATCARPATPNLQALFDSLPAGSVFQSSATACYDVPQGIVLRNPITIIGGTFYDPSTQKPTGPGYDGMKPIILLKEASHVTITGVHVVGANVIGGYHASLVGEAGFKLESASDVTLTDDTSTNTWGDGLEMVADFAKHIRTPVNGLRVDGFTSDNAGRQGVTVAEVSDSVLNDVHVISPADAGFDFESDLPGVGSDNVTISNCTDTNGFNIVEFLGGPITISRCTGFHHVTLRSMTSNAPVTFVGGTLDCKRIDPQPCIHQTGGSLTFDRMSIERTTGRDTVREPAWSLGGGGDLTFVHSSIENPIGYTTAPAVVHFVK